ncbi:hypothetical protein PsYK624_102610 [Phanerochaete sordida]|uniref:Uncharacterized protein n=1 Tax=Phanerochaete sordida TaxID=48140 RepID=A0A9P3LGR4_9APHY|nr:hypothetical protein PsYK624_102610 [Phanerochaete sordida]
MELGVGSSSAVEKWMFGAIGEVDEDAEENLSPSLTYASTATSDESWLHSSVSSTSQQSNRQHLGVAHAPGQRAVQFLPPQSPLIHVRDASLDSTEVPARIETQAEKKQSKKLKKSRPSADGYVSDGGDGYTSDGGTKAKAKKNKKEKKEKGEESDGGYLSDVLRRRRGKDKAKKAKGVPQVGTDVEGDAEETDGGYMSNVASFVRSRKSSTSKVKQKGKSKTGSNDPNTLQSGAEDSDGGYLSSSSVSKKRRFFRLKRGDGDDAPRSSKESIPPVPALPKMALSSGSPGASSPQARSLTPLPIAERFASRSNTPLPRGETATPTSSLSLDIPGGYYSMSSRATTPVSPATRASESSDDRPQERDRLALPPPSPALSTMSLESPGLTHAFKDAESVRTPSIDVLRAFGRQAGMNMRDEDVQAYLSNRGGARDESSLASTSYGSLRDAARADAARDERTSSEGRPSQASEQEVRPNVPTLNLPNPGPKIKRTLSKKQTPAPLVGVGSTRSKRMDVRSYEVLKGHIGDGQTFPSAGSVDDDGSEYEAELMVDVTPATPSSGKSKASGSPALPSPRSRSPSPSSSVSRPNALGKYDLPPPSPPPMGPLPQVPPPLSTSSSSSPPRSSPAALSPHPRSPVPSPLSLDSPHSKRTGPAPPSPLSKSSFTQDDLASPKPTPSPTRQNFISRKLSKRPGTAPASPGPTSGFLESRKPEPPQPETAPSSPPSSTSRLFSFGRNRTNSRPSPSPIAPSPNAPPTSFNPAVAAAGNTAPLALKRVTSNSSVASMASTIQRGRESPFPSKPVLPATPLGNRPPSRSASPIQPVIDRHLASGGVQRTGSKIPADQGAEQTLGVKWQPRATSPLVSGHTNGRQSPYAQPAAKVDDPYDDRSSWVDFDDSPSPSEGGHDSGYSRDSRRFSADASKRQSVASYESQPDIESVLETLNGPGDEDAGYDRQSRYSYRDDERSMYPDDDAPDRDTYYTSTSAFASDAEDAAAPPIPRRSSMLLGKLPAMRGSSSPSPCPSEFDDDTDENRKSRVSILDGKRSGNVRQKLVKRVERMRKESESRTRI